MEQSETDCLRSSLGIRHDKCKCGLCKLCRKNSDCKPKASDGHLMDIAGHLEDEDGKD